MIEMMIDDCIAENGSKVKRIIFQNKDLRLRSCVLTIRLALICPGFFYVNLLCINEDYLQGLNNFNY